MESYDVIVVGAGPAGSAASTLLAEAGVRTLLLEEKRMPRHKVCGEFITPEAFPTLDRLSLMDSLVKAGAREIRTLTLCARNGRELSVPISRMSGSQVALGLSRARLDHIMLDRARSAGVTCIEGAAVKQCIVEARNPIGVEALMLASGEVAGFGASLIVDASGRNSRLMLVRQEQTGPSRQSRPYAGPRASRFYAMKAHLEGVVGIEDRVELYFFRHGYGGLSAIEVGLTNLCFITSEEVLRLCGGDAMKVIESSVATNPAARARLRGAKATGKWLTVGPLSFGKRELSRDRVIAIGDAAGMIDPFTGTGIQIALRSGEILAQSIIDFLSLGRASSNRPLADRGAVGGLSAQEALGRGETLKGAYDAVLSRYRRQYNAEFGERMWAAQALRRAAFRVSMVNLLGGVLVAVPWLARRMIRATRAGS
jgi:flavin-dependent dehydrogenase